MRIMRKKRKQNNTNFNNIKGGIGFATPWSVFFLWNQWVTTKFLRLVMFAIKSAFHSCIIGIYRFRRTSKEEQTGYPTNIIWIHRMEFTTVGIVIAYYWLQLLKQFDVSFRNPFSNNNLVNISFPCPCQKWQEKPCQIRCIDRKLPLYTKAKTSARLTFFWFFC